MSLLTILSLGSAFLNVAQAGHSDDVKHALYVIKDLPKSLAEPYCSKLGTSGKGAGGAYTVTEAQYTITTTLDCSSTGGYGSKPWKTSVSLISILQGILLNNYRNRRLLTTAATLMHRARLITEVVTQLPAQLTAPNMGR
jgi:hypothetical protein